MALVMVVDDEDDVRLLLRLQITAAGHEVVESKGGAEALEALRSGRRRPDCMVLDLRMPVVDGWTVLDAVRKSEELAELAILLVSAHANADDRERSKELGVKCLLNKPVEQEHLAKAIACALKN